MNYTKYVFRLWKKYGSFTYGDETWDAIPDTDPDKVVWGAMVGKELTEKGNNKKTRAYTRERDKAMYLEYLQGTTVTQLTNKYQLSQSRVSNIIKKCKIKTWEKMKNEV